MTFPIFYSCLQVTGCHYSNLSLFKIIEDNRDQTMGYFNIMLSSIYLWLYSPCEPWPLFQFLNLYAVGRTTWTEDLRDARPLPTHRTTQTRNKRTQTSMPRVGFEPTIPVFERAKTLSGHCDRCYVTILM
jgi:hypothetical protein